MEFHKLLNKQINKFLPADYTENQSFHEFIKAINHSYLAFERDTELMNHAFQKSEIEFNEINEKLKIEYELKQKTIATIYDSLQALHDPFDDIFAEDEDDDLIFISKYLNKQIEQQKETEINLANTVELLKMLLANLQSGILVEDENRKILFTNDLFCNMFSIPASPDAIIGVDCTDSAEQSKELFVDTNSFSPRIDAILNKREIQTNELLETITGRFLERDYIPIYIGNEYKGHLWKYTDVTERIKTRNLLEQSEERSRLIMNAALNAIITIDANGIITFWNHQAESIFGWKKEEVIGKTLTETIIPNQHKKGHDNGMKHYLATGEGPALNKQIELTALNKKGKEFHIEISIIPIKQNDEVFFCSFIQDISERKNAENKIKYQEEKYRNIIAHMNLGLIEVDNNHTIRFANQSFSDISGYEFSELIGKNPSEIFIAGDNIDLMEKKKKLRMNGISDVYQIPIKNKSGDRRWWAISGAPNYDDKGNLIGSIGIHLDITEQKQLEIDLENEKIKAEEASKAKEAFLANMSHEIRTPLNAIIGFLRELQKQELTDLQKKYIENSSIASKHLFSIINNVLDISKIEAGEMSLEEEDFILENSIQNITSVLTPIAEQKGIKLSTKISVEISKVFKGDALRIEQILFNLVGNSLKFTQKGKVSIKCKLISEDKSSQNIVITINDTGIGMDKKFMNSIFNKFSQEEKKITRKYGGTGLGMAITKELLNLMNGTISIESEKNKGTCIQIHLSLKKGSNDNIKNEHIKKEFAKIDGAKILLVEDNYMNRLVAQNSLQYFNCTVTEAENGIEALEILKLQNFDVILMDIQMPEMDGIEATKIIRNEFKLKTPIIALTANAFKTEIENCKKAGMNDYVTKPFEEAVLIETICKNLTNKKDKKEIQAGTSSNIKLYNLNSLHNLSRGNEEFVQKMISIFINQTTETLIKIEEAISIKDFIEVSRLIHKIKPSVEGIGVTSIIENVKQLEKTAKEAKEEATITALFSDIKSTLEEVIMQLQSDELE